MRLNVAIQPTATSDASILGVVGGDNAGFPNGRRVFDDVVSIELKAVAGALLNAVVPSFKPDAAAGLALRRGRPDGRAQVGVESAGLRPHVPVELPVPRGPVGRV